MFVAGVEIFLFNVFLVLIRIFCALRLTPFIGATPVPLLPSMGMSIGLALLISPTLEFSVAPVSFGVAVGSVLKEVGVGVSFGLMAKIVFSIFETTGSLVKHFSFSLSFSETGDFSAGDPFSRFYVFVGICAFLVLDGHHAMFSALYGSFISCPIGIGVSDGDLFASMAYGAIGLFSSAFAWGVMLAAPIYVAGLTAETVVSLSTRVFGNSTWSHGGQPLRIVAVQLVGIGILATTVRVGISFLERGIEQLVACCNL